MSINPPVRRKRGCWLYLAGLIIIGMSPVGSFIWDAFLRPILYSGPARDRENQCRRNCRKIFEAVSMYTSDWDEHEPLEKNWSQAIGLPKYGLIQEDDLRCPASESGKGYAINSHLAGLDLSKVEDHDRTVLFFESDTRSGQGGGKADLPENGRHVNRDTYIMADGHVKTYPRGAELKW